MSRISRRLTRWEDWFSDENLSADKRILAAPPSQCAEKAALRFLARGKRRILDLACGVGRDTFYLTGQGLRVVGVDASLNGLRVAQKVGSRQNTIAELVAADARHLPFKDGAFEGVHCFGLLHEFTSERREQDVQEVMSEARRSLRDDGLLVITVQAGEPEKGLPHVQMFSRGMFEQATQGLRPIEIKQYDDVGCTGRTDYRVWYGLFEK